MTGEERPPPIPMPASPVYAGGAKGLAERLLMGRLPYIRDVRQGPDGLLCLVTRSDDGGPFRLEPA